MLKLTPSIKRTLERTERTFESDLEAGITYPITTSVNGIVWTEGETTRVQLENFRKFRKSLEDGTHPLMNCTDREAERNLLKIIYEIARFYEILIPDKIRNIENLDMIDKGLIVRLENFLKVNPENVEANALRNFFNRPRYSSWGMEDAYCEAREFKLVNTLEEFDEILEQQKRVEDISSDSNPNPAIKIAFYRISAHEMIVKKGLRWDYNRFVCDYYGGYEGLDSYKLLHDIKETGIYYVYIPQVVS